MQCIVIPICSTINYICLYANSAVSLIDYHESKPGDELGHDIDGVLCDVSSADGQNFNTSKETRGKYLCPSATATSGAAEARKFLSLARDYEIPLSLDKTGNQDGEKY